MSGNRELDLGSLTLYDSTALPIVEPSEDIHEIITARFVDNFKYVFSELMSLRKQELTRIESVPE